MFKRKSFLFSTLLVPALSLQLVACGGGEEEPEEMPADDGTTEDVDETAEVEEPEKPDSLEMWVNDEESQLEAHEDMAEDFEAEYGIEVEITPMSMLDQTEAMSLDGPAGQGPDLFFQPHDRVGDVVLQGLAAELNLTEDQEERLMNDYNEEAVESFSYEGSQYGIPSVVETYALFYNEQHLDEAPETFEELFEFSQEFTNRDADEYGFLMEMGNIYFTYPFFDAFGGYIFGQDADGAYDPEDIGLNNEGSVQGAEFIQQWFDEDLHPTGVDGEILNGLFEQGTVAAAINGPWAIPDYESALGDDLAVAPIPTIEGNDANSFAGNKGWHVSEYSENQHWATELALFITNVENSEHYFDLAGELPANLEAEVEDEFFEPILEQTETTQPMPNIPEMDQVWDPANDGLEFITQGDDAEEVMDEVVQEIRDAIMMMGQ
ncbi:extracellular solute-binding protein [Texcoconibacillus texcoconensis]|uniref:Arabinogalactan oligomer/maltooligosaccharide transport system substrate-binding protein n=1 Tax=Texcoconibacillus texcoconensis TaxID=1095777 RepID=A0A840QS64_9BACI|nr:extracellular solute-binding protein [Texcoconibacillus texcoconensis]MBB5174342.1 arabinogalactan oligomer/maltooligosaccharide transport system substrate-binding protein [Texcoconibacillus texcoconensis]